MCDERETSAPRDSRVHCTIGCDHHIARTRHYRAPTQIFAGDFRGETNRDKKRHEIGKMFLYKTGADDNIMRSHRFVLKEWEISGMISVYSVSCVLQWVALHWSTIGMLDADTTLSSGLGTEGHFADSLKLMNVLTEYLQL